MPFYKTWWFWTAAGVVVAGGIAATVGGSAPKGLTTCADSTHGCAFFAQLDLQGKWRWAVVGARALKADDSAFNDIAFHGPDVYLVGTATSTSFGGLSIPRGSLQVGAILVGKNPHYLFGPP